METKNFDDLKADPRNPRTINQHDHEALKNSLAKFGDLSGFVFNVRNQQLVGGHQRTSAFNRMPGEKKIVVTTRFEHPNHVGTVAVGYVEYAGELYAYREVDWDEATHLAANVAANRISGEFDLEKLADVNQLIKEANQDLLVLTGQDERELAQLEKLSSSPEADHDKPDTLGEKLNFHVNEEQLRIVDEVLGHVLAHHHVNDTGNTDMRANALHFLCREYLGRINDGVVDHAEAVT